MSVQLGRLVYTIVIRKVVDRVMIHPDVVAVALDKVEGFAFERFVNSFLPAITGHTYVPLGGNHDGGADAFGGDPVHERAGNAEIFYQASIQQDFRAKIRDTVRTLRKFGREPRKLNYVTSRTIQYIDNEEETLSIELGVSLRIFDGKYIGSHVNNDAATKAAFDHHLRHYTDYLKHVGSSSIVPSSKHVKSPAVFVFLRQELDRRSGNDSLVNSVIDSLALWALEGTDPDAGIFMKAGEVESKILDTVPSAKAIIKDRVGRRLQVLSAKSYPGGRQAHWHKKEDKFCLPLETRERIESENLEDEALRLHVLNSLYARAARENTDQDEERLRLSAEVSLRALQLVFEREGLEFAHFIDGGSSQEPPAVSDAVRDAITEYKIYGADSVTMARICLSAARACFYQSSPQERLYLGKLARTYALLFTLNNEPRLVQYFQDMTADFYLYVGTDMLVRALSEHYLDVPDQLTKNTLLLAARAGAKLILTEPVLGEVLSHIRATDNEYRSYFRHVADEASEELAMNAPKILVRTYMYAHRAFKENKRGPRSWENFLNQFCTYSTLHKNEARADLRRYLQSAFGMEYRTTADLQNLVDQDTVAKIADDLEPRKDRRLAENDALLACAVFGRRRVKREESAITEFGYQTWWLTNETMILRHTYELRRANQNEKYMMRPDFLLNFMTFAPAAADARRAFSNVFPTPLGIRLSKRMDEDAFHKIMQDVKDADEMDESRRSAAMARISDALKGDFHKQYMISFGTSD
ncbi:hypothetical protein [Catellatospora sp. NPDC049133]|uniref:hypothetical protein n=1 Tax=Catellatospora sp. NPDC049133 TaxID=3155499 RepID=UPI003404A06C